MIVIDASAIVDCLINADDLKRFTELSDAEDWHAAPNFIDVEVLSGLRRLELGGFVSAKRAREAMGDFRLFNILRFDMTELVPDIWRLRHNVTTYDAAYIVLSKVLNVRIVTRDRKLANSNGHSARIVVL